MDRFKAMVRSTAVAIHWRLWGRRRAGDYGELSWLVCPEKTAEHRLWRQELDRLAVTTFLTIDKTDVQLTARRWQNQLLNEEPAWNPPLPPT